MGMSIHEISKRLGHCRKTIRKVLRWDGSPPQYKLTKRRPTRVVTSEVTDFTYTILRNDRAVHPKQRHTARRIFERLIVETGYEGSESGIRRLVARIRRELGEAQKSITTPLSFEPGEETQVDWGYAQVEIGGELVKACLLYLVLCYSRRTFVVAFPAEKQECFLEGHLLAFEHFGGVTGRCCYDNLSSAVKRVFLGSSREENETFLRFRSYHGFEVRYCTPGKSGAHEKGLVERRVATFRRRFLVPIPEFESWQCFNEYLVGCSSQLDQKTHPSSSESLETVFNEKEASSLRPLPKHRFSCCKTLSVQADGQSRIRYQGVVYSLPSQFGRQRVELRAYFNRLEVFFRQKLICQWGRSFCKGEEFYDYRHYVPLLSKAPGASLNGKPYRHMPEVLRNYREELLARKDRREAARALAKVLLLLRKHTEEEVLEAVELALLCGTVDPDSVKNLLLQMNGQWSQTKQPLNLIEAPTEVREMRVSPRELNCYDSLLEVAQ